MAIYYTIHTRRTWKKFQKQGYIAGEKAYASFPMQYEWMMSEMKKRLPRYQGEFPVWLWTEIPPLYRFEQTNVRRKKFVLIAVEVEEEDVLFSDFDAWHIPLNHQTFQEGQTECLDWDKVFDFAWLRTHFYENESEKITLQGTTGSIPLSKVVSVKHFTSKTLY